MKKINLIKKFALIVFFVVLICHMVIYFIVINYNIQSLSALRYSALLSVIMLILVLSFFIKTQITNPILRLTRALKSVQDGIQHWVGTAFLSRSISINRNDEIGDLASAFNQMIHEMGEKEKIRSILGKVVSDEIADELVVKKVKRGGEKKDAVILFVDIRNFTRYSESMEPSNVLLMLNIVFTEMAAIIERNQGVIDKYIGDAVMALFGVPIESSNSEYNAINTARELVYSLESINKTLTLNGLPAIDIGVGINGGSVIAGNVGSNERMNYTVIGNTVNLASRLQDLNKTYYTRIIVSDAVKRKTEEFIYRFIDLVRVSGINEPVSIYEPIGLKDEPNKALLKELDSYNEASTAYTNKEWEKASLLFSQLYDRHQDNLYNAYYLRCIYFLSSPPAHDWDGIYSVGK